MSQFKLYKGQQEIAIVVTKHAEEKMKERHLDNSVDKAFTMVIDAIKHLEINGYTWSNFRESDYYEVRDFRQNNACAFVLGFESDAEELRKFGYQDIPDQIINIVTWFHKPKEFYLRTYNLITKLVKVRQDNLTLDNTRKMETAIIVIDKNGNISSPKVHSNFEEWFTNEYPNAIFPDTKHSPISRSKTEYDIKTS